MAQNGRIPANAIEGKNRKDLGCVGTWRGIWFVRTGYENGSFLRATKLPNPERGTEIANHMTMRANMVPNGTAPDDSAKTKKKLKRIAK